MTRERLPRATHVGELQIGNLTIPCAVLDDGRRVLTQRGLQTGLGLAESGGAQRMLRFSMAISQEPALAAEISARIKAAISFVPRTGGVARGFDALLLAYICKAVRASARAGVLPAQYDHIVERCERLLDGFAIVGIYALIDEATGYEKDKKRNELQKILAAYIAPELLPWTKRFPDEFYEQMFRLLGWGWDPSTAAKPGVVGHLTNLVVYERLPPGVLEELRTRNPTTEPGRRRHKHHQWLTPDVGQSHLNNHLLAVIPMMRGSRTWAGFVQVVTQAWPKPNDQLKLFNLDDWRGD